MQNLLRMTSKRRFQTQCSGLWLAGYVALLGLTVAPGCSDEAGDDTSEEDSATRRELDEAEEEREEAEDALADAQAELMEAQEAREAAEAELAELEESDAELTEAQAALEAREEELAAAEAALAAAEEAAAQAQAELEAAQEAANQGPLYAITGTVFGPEGSTAYVALVPSLDASTEIDYAEVIEVAGGASLFGSDENGVFALGREESPTITKYELSAEGELTEGATISFASFGLTHLWFDPGLVPFVAEDKAYVIDSSQMQVVTWDPAAMEITGSFELTGVADADYPSALFEPDPTRRGSELLVAVNHSGDDATAPFSSVIVIDTENDSVSQVIHEERCGGLWDSVMASNGDVYFATGVWDAAQHRVYGTEIAPEPCIVRILAGEVEFDPDFFETSSTLTGGSAAGALVAGGGDFAFVKGLDETALGEITGESFDAVWGEANWNWWRLELGSAEPAERVTNIAASGAAGGELVSEGKSYARNVTADYSETTLLDMSAEVPVEKITVRGFPYGIIRLR